MRTASYCWVITKDHLARDGQWETDDTGTFGPRTAQHEDVMRALSEGRPFEMYDDDGTLYYSGRLWTKNPPGTERDFIPLDDFGMPNAGCTRITYSGVPL